MLAKKQRLTRAEFEHYFKTGKRSHTPHLQLIVASNDHFHGAVVVGKKVFKRAVKRNTLRRQLYGVLYRFHQGTSATGVYIVITKPNITSLSRREAVAELTGLLQNSRI